MVDITSSDRQNPNPDQNQPDKNPHHQLMEWMNSPNIAEDLEEDRLGKIGHDVKFEYDIDVTSRHDWMDQSDKAMKLAMQVAETKQYPWPKACLSLDTDILTAEGWKPIADVKVGEMVYSRDPGGFAGYFPVSNTYRYRADSVVHFLSKSIDLLATPNHNMLVDNHLGNPRMVPAGEFLTRTLPKKYIPLTSEWEGNAPPQIHGLDAKAYMRFLGWYLSEGSAVNTHSGPGSFVIAQSKSANPDKYEQIKRDIEACGFTHRECKNVNRGILVHAKSMPSSLKRELRGLGINYTKFIPQHVTMLCSSLLKELLDTLVAGDGHSRMRIGKKKISVTYSTTSYKLASQVQELCQKIGMRGTIYTISAKNGGRINNRQIVGRRPCYTVNFNHNKRIKITRIGRKLIPDYNQDVACVEVNPFHTIYVRRNGRAVWCGNSNVIYPLMTTSAIQFAARAYPAIVSGRSVVKGVVVGDDSGVFHLDPNTGQSTPVVPPGDKANRASRIGEHMSWQLLDEQTEWEEETDKLLHILPIVGCCFRKTYFDSSKGRNASLLVSAARLVINYHAKSMETAPRITEELTLYPLEIVEYERAGVYKVIQYSTSHEGDPGDKDAPQVFLEQHRTLDLDDDGYPEPYVVTVHRETQKVVRIVARYDHDGVKVDKKGEVAKIEPIHYYTKYDFLPNPDGGIYGVGFGQLLRPINEATNTSLNMLIDAGHLANTGGGFIGKGLSMNTGMVKFIPGEYKMVNVSGATVKENIVPLTFPGPSPVLFNLLGMLVEAGKEIAAVKDVLTGEQKEANQPATTTLALIEQGLKVFTAIYKRIHRALKKELDKLYRLNSIYLPDSGAGYRQNNEWRTISRSDYQKGGGVEPVSDPSMVSDMQKLGRAQFLMGFLSDPGFNGITIRKRVLDAAMIEKPEELLVEQPPPNPALIKDMKEVAIREERMKAEATKDYAQAILFITQAQQVAGENNLAYYEHMLEVFRTKLEASQGNDSGGGKTKRVDPGSVGDVETPSRDEAVPSLPGGLPLGAQGNGMGLPAEGAPTGAGPGSALPGGVGG